MTPAPDKPRASRNRRRGDMHGLMTRLSGAAAVVVVIAVLFNIGIHKLERSPPVQPEYGVKSPELAAGQADALPILPPDPLVQGIADLEAKRGLIEAAVRSFFQAPTVAGRLAFSRDPERVRPLMEGYYLRHAIRARMVSGLGTCQSVAEKGHRLGYVQVLFGKEAPVSVIVEEADDGHICVDWESLVRYSEMDWEDFLSQKPITPTLLRVIASHSPSTASDGREWLEILSPGDNRRLKVSFDRQDPKLQPLVEQLQLGSWKNVPLTLRVCYSEPKAKADAVRITGIEGKGWLILTNRRS